MHALGRAFGPLEAIRGHLKSEKVTTVLCENHFFENAFCSFLEILMALFGPSSRFLGRSGAQSGSQKYPKTCPDVVKKTFQKWTSFLLVLGLLLGPFWAQKSVGSGGPIFQGFSGWLLMAQERRSGADSGAILAPLGPILALSWTIRSPSGPIWPPSASNLGHFGPSQAHLEPSSVHLMPHYRRGDLGPVLVPSWPALAPS